MFNLAKEYEAGVHFGICSMVELSVRSAGNTCTIGGWSMPWTRGKIAHIPNTDLSQGQKKSI